MTKWVQRLRGAIGTGVTWAIVWAMAGIAIGVTTLLPWHPFDGFLRVMDAPLPAMAVPGFFAGLFFSGVLSLTARRRRFRELSLVRFAVWGAVGGALLTAFPFVLVAIGLASTEGSAHKAWDAVAAVGPVFVLLSSASAVGSLLLARRAETHVHSGNAVFEHGERAGDPQQITEGLSDLPTRGRTGDRQDEHARPEW